MAYVLHNLMDAAKLPARRTVVPTAGDAAVIVLLEYHRNSCDYLSDRDSQPDPSGHLLIVLEQCLLCRYHSKYIDSFHY